jgi:hypothetical protein
MKYPTRKEIRHRQEFATAANAILFARNAKPVEVTKPKPPKTEAQKLKEAVAVLKGLARAHINIHGTILKEDGRIIRLKGKASTGLAIIACASLLEMDASGAGKIKLINEAQGDFSKAEQAAINDVIKAIRPRSPVEKVKPIINETQAAKITREVHGQADGDFSLSPEQVKALNSLNKPATLKKTNNSSKKLIL